jgi:nicotinate-nucleotide pyrophosphorylase (carboxylating)
MVLIKNNHIAVVGSVGQAVRAARGHVSFSTKVSCEARSLEETIEAIESGADIVLLDNLKPDKIKKIHEVLVEKGLRQKVILEVSGGIDKSNLAEYAKTGVDVISSGSLTHSYDSSNFNMRISLL